MRSLSVLLCLVLGLISPAQADTFSWPGGASTAISLSYDDTLDSQLDHARPALNRHNIKASFYLTLATPVLTERLDEWRALAAEGHELGNHSIYHPCSGSPPGRNWVAPHNDLDDRLIIQMREELQVANAFLHSIDGRTQRTFTPPCLDTHVSDGNYIEAVRDLFVAIKGQEDQFPDGFATMIMPDGQSGEELIAMVEAAAQQHRLVHVLFHGVGADHMAVSLEAHEALLSYLAGNDQRYWMDTYLNIMGHLNSHFGH